MLMKMKKARMMLIKIKIACMMKISFLLKNKIDEVENDVDDENHVSVEKWF